MSEQNLTKAVNLTLGFYGKLPSLGDFVSRRLPQEFISSWDSWLQSSLAASHEILGEQWLQSYLTCPIWRFALSPGLCGKDAWLGIVMPSVDRVGRYFPLTIACKVTTHAPLINVFSESCDWFEELESVALTALENDLAVEEFDEMVKGIAAFNINEEENTVLNQAKAQSVENHAFYLAFESLDIKTERIFPSLTSLLINTYISVHSLWCTVGSENIKPGFLVADGLPPFTAYAGMITGQFQQTGWELHQQQVVSRPIIQTQNKALEKACLTLDIVNSNNISSTPEQRASENAWHSFSRTDTGKVRQHNEDAILDRPDLGLWVVADGMGGHLAGDVASKKIIHTLNELDLSSSLDLTITQVKAALQGVNQELNELAAKTSGHQVVGSTVVVLMARKTHFACLWAGDSRLYRLRDNKLLQLTIDHCSEQEDITDVLNIGSNAGLKQNNVITRAVGGYEELELDCQIIDIQSGDLLMLSSDGLDKEVSFQEIEQVLVENDYSDSVEILLERVLNRGSRDNVSVIVVEVNKGISRIKSLC